MIELLKLIGKKNTEKILTHPKFPDGLHELIRRGYVDVKDENFYLTEKGETASINGLQSEIEDKDFAQSRRNEMNKSITEFPTSTSSQKPKSVFFIVLTFFIFFIKFLSNPKIFKGKNKTKILGK